MLTDGTVVWLNAGSTLRYADNFNAKNRVVELEGEAYFEVEKQSDKTPFLVKTGCYDVVVKGTKFNVTSYPEDPFRQRHYWKELSMFCIKAGKWK